MALLTKRKREEIEIVDLIEDFDEDNETVQESPEQIIYHLTELPSPPRKKVKRKLNFTKLSMNDTPKKLSCKLRVTKDVMCDVSLTRLRGNVELYEEFKKQMRAITTLRVADFTTRSSLLIHKDLNSNSSFLENVLEFEVKGLNNESQCVLSYLKGILARKEEVAVVPLKNSPYQLLIFENDFQKTKQTDPLQLDFTKFQTSLSAIMIKKFCLILDLDETLIRTRIPKDENDRPTHAQEHEFKLMNARYISCVRPGTEEVLRWACSIFQVYVFTNAIYEYGKQVLNFLDPKREHLLKGIDINNDVQIKRILKSREVMSQVDYIQKPLGLKELEKFGLDPADCVILDDDTSVWKNKENLLPFQEIVKCRAPKDFFYKLRSESWKKLDKLHKTKYKCRVEYEKHKSAQKELLRELKKPTLSQEKVLTNCSQ